MPSTRTYSLQVPGVNASWHPEFVREHVNVDISVAVQTPIGLLTPIVKDVDSKRMQGISSEIKALAKKVGGGVCVWGGRWCGGGDSGSL